MTTPVVLLILFTILASIFVVWLVIICWPVIDREKALAQLAAWREHWK